MSTKKIKMIFAGTPDFAVPGFKALLADKNFKIAAVITQSDKKIGRHQILTPSAIKIAAQKNKIPVWQPNKIIDIKEKIAETKPDIAVLIAYGQIIPAKILNIPAYGWVNVHGSLLPKYRGAACIQAPILAGDKKTGITIIKMETGLDTGPILKQTEIKISPGETTETLHNKLAALGAAILLDTIKNYIKGKIKPKPQDNSRASYVKMIKKEDGKINWQKEAKEIEQMIRALNPWPGTFTEYKMKKARNKILKVLEVEHEPLKINKYQRGKIFLRKGQLAIQCGQDALIIKKLQPADKKAITAKEFLSGYSNLIGNILK